MGMMGENIAEELQRYRDLCGHVQIADVPGRHEPGTGSLNYAAIFRILDEVYDGWVGCEYTPAADTRAGLDWCGKNSNLTAS